MNNPTLPADDTSDTSEPTDATELRVDAVATGAPVAYTWHKSDTSIKVTDPKDTTTVTEADIRVMTKKARALYDTLERRGVDWGRMKRGDNPLWQVGIELGSGKLQGPKFLQIAVAHLLEVNSVSNAELRDKLQQELGWSKSTAYSHISILQSLLTYVEVVTVDNDAFVRVTE